jgi:indole-3-glycerol phosphate synthase
MTSLPSILRKRRRRVADRRARVPLQALRDRAASMPPPRGFLPALRLRRAIIAEFKRASPSGYRAPESVQAAALARQYEAGGARALSILTEPDFFLGSDDDLIAARTAAGLPVLRKDFIVDEYQIHETRALGADALLLIVAVLSRTQFRSLRACASESGLGVLVEVHTEADLEFALAETCPLIGINNRDLSTFRVDPGHALRLMKRIPRGSACIVIESGLRHAEDLVQYHRAGADAYLIGQAVMRADSPQGLVRRMVAALEAES